MAKDYQIKFYPDCGHSPVWPLVPHALLDLEAEGFAQIPWIAPVWNDPCMAAVGLDGEVLGFVIYRGDQVASSWYIMLAWVAPQHRRQGIHSALFNALVERAKLRGYVRSIDSGTHINNHAAQAAFAVQGRAKVSVSYTYQIRDWVEGKEPCDIT